MHDLVGKEVPMEIGRGHLITYRAALNILEYGEGRYRSSALADLVRCLKLTQQLPDIIGTGDICIPNEFGEPESHLETVRAALTYTRKLYFIARHSPCMLRLWAEALERVLPDGYPGRRLPLLSFVSTTSPFVLDPQSAGVLMYCVEKGIPVLCDPCPMAGGTSPYPIAGTFVLQIAENMFLLTAKHALDPELPALVGGAPASLDMRTAEVAYGAVERRLMMLTLLDIFRMWEIPAFSPANSVDSCLCDVQIGAEKTWTYPCSELSDACAGTSIGAVTNGKTVSLDQMLIDMDLIRCARRFSKGIDTGGAARSVDALLRVPHGGSFLTEEGTISRLRGGHEYYEPDLFNRGGAGGRALLDRAHDRVEQILDGYEPPLDGAMKRRLDAYIDAQKGKTDHEA